MIVKMKKSTVICLLSEKERALTLLRDLGVLHVESSELKDSDDRATLEARFLEAKHASLIMAAVKTKDKPEKSQDLLSGEELCRQIINLDKERARIFKELDQLKRDKVLLLPWGNFSQELINTLKDNGVFIYLCSGTPEEFAELPEDIAVEVMKSDKHRIYFAIFANKQLDESLLPLARVPAAYSLNEVSAKIADCEKKLSDIDASLIKLIPQLPKLEDYIQNLDEQIEFTFNRDGMFESGAVASISGYCPVPEVENLKKAAEKHGWGVWLTDPTDDDNPPTQIVMPKIFEYSKALLGFIGVSPGYKEWDTSVCFLLFFTLFVSMIVGDAGYGVLLLIAALFAKIKLGDNKKFKYWITLFISLSIATIIWGFITGNYFAIPAKYIPTWMQGFEWFTDPVLKDKHIMLVCFLIAAVHLSFARLWKASLVINSTRALGEIGWGLILWGNFFLARKLIVYPDSVWPMTTMGILYGLGFFFVFAFGTNWKKMDEIFGLVFGMSGTFVDLLSYIRLFAVGLSSYYIAKSFNDMGVMLFNARVPLANALQEWGVTFLGLSSEKTWIPLFSLFMVIVMLAGHIGNMVLAVLGVLVHGIRLNTLEFSNHMGLQWLGHIYKPFKKNDEKNIGH